MRYGLSLVTVIAWGLWFGGLAALFLFVSYLFVSDRKTAAIAAPKMFAVFEIYQIAVGAVGLIAAAMWRLASPGRAAISAVFAMLALAAVGTIVTALAIHRPMDRLRIEGQTQSPQFERLHKMAERVYTAQAVALLIGGIILPVALAPARARNRPTTPDADAPTADDSPAARPHAATSTPAASQTD